MKMNRCFSCVLLGIALLVWGCSGGGGGDSAVPATTTPAPTTGVLKVSMTDAATTDFKAIYVTVKEVAVHADGGDWVVVSSTDNLPKTVNLLDLVNGVREELGLATLPTGHYTQMRLILADQPDDSLNILSHKHPYANYFIDQFNQSIELKVPSGFQTGIKIVKDFDISANQTTELILDFDAAKSIVRAGNSGHWLLKPTIKLLNTTEYCIIQGRVTDNTPSHAAIPGVLVSAQVYDGSAAAPEDQVQIEAATVTDNNGEYKLFVKPGTYTVVAYKDNYAPSFTAQKIVTTAGSITTVNFTLHSASMGAVSGMVNITGADQDQYATVSIRQAVTVGGNSEQIEIKSLNVADGGTFTNVPLPQGTYTAVISTFGKTTITTPQFTVTPGNNTSIGTIAF